MWLQTAVLRAESGESSRNVRAMDIDQPYCLCGLPYDPSVFMIQCDVCKDWFHSSCTGFQEQVAPEIEKYHCPRCEPRMGPSLYKPIRNLHRHEYWDPDAHNKPVQTGTATFIRELQARHFHDENDVVRFVTGHMLTEENFLANHFDRPIVIPNKDGLRMTMPCPDTFTLYDVEAHVGGDHEMDVIDVVRQSDLRMKLKDFVRYFYAVNKTKVYNVVSLEFSKTGLSQFIEAPQAAREIDWANVIWPREYAAEQPCVSKYCLMSVKDSFTDFHIDFGGTSVWYHVLRGQKIFYLIKPTSANLTLYQQWMSSSTQSETFFGDQADQCFDCVLSAGQTMMIPTGWIHAVLTPQDSLVFGGNFLHSLNIPMQLQVYDIEKKVKTALKFLYPFFETVHWFAAQKLLFQLQKINVDGKKCDERLLHGLKVLLTYLRSWNADKDLVMTSKEQIPNGMNVTKLFKDISKEIRQAERIVNTLNPPKPERESKRNRKRPVNKDFVDFPPFKRNANDIDQCDISPVKPAKKAAIPKGASPKVSQSDKSKKSVKSKLELPPPWPALPETATAVHAGGTVLKIKFGARDMIPVIDMNTIPSNATNMTHKSIYDFKEDDSYDDLFIDESPQPRSKVSKNQTGWVVKNFQDNVNNDANPSNGIESLLKASALATKYIDRNEQGTQDAIAGMLSIGQTFVQPKKSSKHRKRIADNLLDEDVLNEVHQDDDYIYPAIDNSEEDLYHATSMDELWNPKVRVGPLLPKMNRPAREGTRRQAIEKVLEAAAKSSKSISSKASRRSATKRKKLKASKLLLDNPIPTISHNNVPGSSSSSLSSSQVVPPPTAQSPVTSRNKKGMKTAKQRLGKILKIHKMMH